MEKKEFNNLHYAIKSTREKMIATAIKKGYSHNETLIYSHELDGLINEVLHQRAKVQN